MLCEHGIDWAVSCPYGCPDEASAVAERVIALLDLAGIRACWEYPGYIHVRIPDGPADLAYGLDGEVWCGHYVNQDDGDAALPGRYVDDLDHTASSVAIARVLVRGVDAITERA